MHVLVPHASPRPAEYARRIGAVRRRVVEARPQHVVDRDGPRAESVAQAGLNGVPFWDRGHDAPYRRAREGALLVDALVRLGGCTPRSALHVDVGEVHVERRPVATGIVGRAGGVLVANADPREERRPRLSVDGLVEGSIAGVLDLALDETTALPGFVGTVVRLVCRVLWEGVRGGMVRVEKYIAGL